MPKPGEFFVGALDLFAILLPGAITTAILAPRVGDLVIGPLIPVPASEAEKWVAFLVFAYFIGHIIFLIGSYIDFFYNELRERFKPYGNESAYQCATRIRDSLIDTSERGALNTFQWARAVLIAKNPDAAGDVHRLEADSKFFRSLVVVCALSSAAFFSSGQSAEGLVVMALTLPCFARYCERRLKSTTQAYIHVISMHRLGLLNPSGTAENTRV